MKNNFKIIIGIWVSIACFVNVASAHVLSCVDERNIGEEAINFYESREFKVDDPLSIYNLQNEIIGSNKDELNGFLDRGDRNRWLAPVKISYEKTINAFSFPGGYTYITNDMLNFISNIDDDGKETAIRENDWTKCYNLYTRGTIAFVLAHEFGHFYNQDYLRKYDKQYTTNLLFSLFGQNTGATTQMIQQEAKGLLDKINTRQMSLRTEEQADEKAVQYIENIPWYSIGNGAIFFSRLAKLEENSNVKQPWLTPHSESTVRLQRVLDYMNTISNGRVEFKNNRLYVDGKLFNNNGLAPSKDDITSMDRTYFVAGQIAKAIKKGLWNPKEANMDFIYQNAIYPELGKNNHDTFIILTNKKNNKDIIIFDAVALDYEHLTQKNNFSPSQKEEKAYVVSLVNLFQNQK